MDYKGLRDRHLNIFCGYGTEHKENNITKALINTLDSLNAKEQAKFLGTLIGKTIEYADLSVTFYLQKKPSENDVKKIPKKNRFIIGMSPTGKCWGYTSEDIQDDNKLREEIEKDWKKEHNYVTNEELKEIVAKVLEDIHKRREDKGSIPDAWIFISNRVESYLIIIENKLYNLDPDQINNHIEKSLLQVNESDKNKPIYVTFERIAELINNSRTFLTEQFVEYLTILGYLHLDSLPLACSADKEIREKLSIYAGNIVMNDIFRSDVGRRSNHVIRKHLDKRTYLREINMCFENCKNDDGNIYISLALAPTMTSAKCMYNNINLPFNLNLQNNHIKNPYPSLHLQFNRGRNINISHIRESDWDIIDYINYWKSHTSNLRLMTPKEASSFYSQLSTEGKIPNELGTRVTNYLSTKNNSINVVPEIIYKIVWTCEEIANMKDNTEFENSVKEALNIFLDSINYTVEGIND